MSRSTKGILSRNHLPWHGWAFGLFVLFMLTIAAIDFVKLLGPDEAYIRQQGWGEAGIAYFSNYPILLRLIWAISLVAGIASVGLLFSGVRYAATAALVAASAQAGLVAITFASMGRLEALGATTALTDTLALLMSLIFAWYCYQHFKPWR